MNVFDFTRMKLTTWYVTAIMAVSIMFSIVIYSGITRNIEETFIRAERRLSRNPGFFIQELEVSKQKVAYNLLYANCLIFVLSSVVSYVLASKTLRPLEDTLLKQKRFVADASHELRTPLTSLRTSIEVALRDKSLGKKSKKFLHDNLSDVNSLQELIDSLLQLASHEDKEIAKQLIDVQEVISRAIKTIKPIANEKNIQITSKLVHKQILASETGLYQLVTILLDNAIKYSNPKSKIKISLVTAKRFVKIIVSDSGIGINKQYLRHIFDRFYRIDSSRTVSQKPGFGLGLSVAKQIVENHSGSILVKSDLGKGTTFIVTLPI